MLQSCGTVSARQLPSAKPVCSAPEASPLKNSQASSNDETVPVPPVPTVPAAPVLPAPPLVAPVPAVPLVPAPPEVPAAPLAPVPASPLVPALPAVIPPLPPPPPVPPADPPAQPSNPPMTNPKTARQARDMDNGFKGASRQNGCAPPTNPSRYTGAVSQFAPQGPGLVGTVLGGSYRITRLIGQGGMGAVYEGVQVRLERRVAIKLMARELSANPEAIARFRREAEVTSQLGHPHIVQVFDFGAAPGGEPYLVMEYLEGEDLEKRIQRVGRLPPAAVSHIVRQVSSALSATHAKGIVHRDLKPANVFLLSVEGETDFVKVVDFGISKVRSATTKLTAALAVMGTPNYMAPEQAAGRVNDIDARTDQWALACIAYELLAGRPPFVGEDVASLLYQVIHQAPAPLREVHPGLPGAFEGVLGRALSKTQADRFSTMTEFARAFEG